MMFNEYDYHLSDLIKARHLDVDKTYLVSTIHAVSPTNNNGSAYPWGDRNTKVPVRVTAENQRFWTALVLPHYIRQGSLAISKPYSITIDKWEFYHGYFKALEYDYDKEYVG